MDSMDKSLDNSLESTMNMTQDEIEKLLAQQQNVTNEVSMDMQDSDLESLLAQLEADNHEESMGIADLFQKADNNEPIDEGIASLINTQEEDSGTEYSVDDLFSEDLPVKQTFFQKWIQKIKDKKAAKKIKKKENTEKEANHNKDTMSDALNMLQGDSKENIPLKPIKEKKKKEKIKKEKQKKQEIVPEEADEQELIKEKPKDKKNKKGKADKQKNKAAKQEEKKKKQEEKKKKKEIVLDDDLTIEEAIREYEEEQEAPNGKKIGIVFVAAILIMLGFLVVNFYYTGYANRKLAQEAYAQQNYLECYQLLYNQNMNDSQAVMYHRSELILKMDIFRKDYNDYVLEKKWLEALDELTQFVHGYSELSEHAKTWNSLKVVESIYVQVENILEQDYETDAETINEIANLESDVDYTRELHKIIESKEKKDAIQIKYPDILPEEDARIFLEK